MASREKKTNVGRKQQTSAPSPVPSSKEETTTETPASESAPNSEKPTDESNIALKAKKAVVSAAAIKKKAIQRKIKINLKSKAKPKVVNKKLISKTKKDKDALLKNGVAEKVIRKRVVSTKKAAELSEAATDKRKKKTIGELDPISSAIDRVVRNATRTPKRRKAMSTVTTINVVPKTNMEDMIKKEPPEEEVMAEVAAVATVVVEKVEKKRVAKKQKISESKIGEKFDAKKKIKKENIEQVLNAVDTSDSNVIDNLGLFAHKAAKVQPLIIRRHSIAKFPVTQLDVRIRDKSAFSKRPKRLASRSRLSSESKRNNPYKRSDSPMRILRNGKNRRYKQFPLFDGLDSEYKMRRRLAGDFGGSDISKISGYESDSSYSDKASVHENTDTDKDKEIQLKKDILEALENNPPDTVEGKQIVENVSAVIKRSLSMEATVQSAESSKTIDTNSNLCSKSNPTTPVKTEFDEEHDENFKVPEKNVLLGIMKQAFNNETSTTADGEGHEKRKTRSSTKKPKLLEIEVNTTIAAEPVPMETAMPLGPEITITTDVKSSLPIEQSVEEAEAELVDILSLDTEISMNGDSNHVNSNTKEQGDMQLTKESPESLAEKSQILKALGLQTLEEAEEARKKQVPKAESYTGTLKTVIKLNRRDDKKKRSGIKMTLQKKGKSAKDDENLKYDDDEYKIMKEGSSSWKAHPGGQSSDTAGAQRKSHYYNRSNMDGSSEHTSDGDNNAIEEGSGKLLVIPEKASSFSVHPGRLCKDECSYCFGKFGLFDTPCHIAQLKSVERQEKILANERHLTKDSCLCDACYRHVDRKVNMRTLNKKKNILVAPAPRENHCHVLGCNMEATNILKRRWLIRMRKEVCQVVNIDLDNPGLHSIPVCKEHHTAVQHLMDCSMCKRKLAGNHIHYLGSEWHEVNIALNKMSIPIKLNDRPIVCKLCRCFATLALKGTDDQTASFYSQYKRRLLHFHNVELMNENEAAEPIMAPVRESSKQDNNTTSRKRKRMNKNQSGSHNSEMHIVHSGVADDRSDKVPFSDSRPESPNEYMVDYRTLIPNVAIECLTDSEETCKELSKKPSLSIRRISKNEVQDKKRMQRSEMAVQRLGSNPSISVRQLFPGEEEIPLNGFIEFNNAKEKTPEGWEKCVSTIQYDPEIKMLWNELQKPYGNQSSFLRHLILLEKYFRNGDLILSPHASHHSINYTDSVQNRLRAYDNISMNAANSVKPVSLMPFNTPKSLPSLFEKSEMKEKCSLTTLPVSSSTPNVNAASTSQPVFKNVGTPLTITPTISNNLSQIANSQANQQANGKSKPPGLISLQQTAKASSAKPQSQKIKFPITKNWRPNLIPIDPAAKPEKKPGLVQVISGGKPYHITVEDYKKMCAIKRTFDLRQKRLQETLRSQVMGGSSPLLKNISQRKSITISQSPSSNNSDQDTDQDVMENGGNSKSNASFSDSSSSSKMPLNLPKIPKSLTVIPQTVKAVSQSSATVSTNNSRPSSPQQQPVATKTKSKS